jgi:hypothetical protein
MRVRSLLSLPFAVVALGGCLASTAGDWRRGSAAIAGEHEVAVALGDDEAAADRFDPGALPDVPAPQHVRPCCAFGMDLKMSLRGSTVPGYKVSNIVSVTEIGHHEYDNGLVSFSDALSRAINLEKNGLVYTCRGGFVDVAHVRDNADLTFYLAMHLLPLLPGPGVVTLEGDGAVRRIVLKKVPAELMQRLGRWEAAITLAQWAAFQISVWHEIVTFYDYESIKGFSEKVSAFSLEDLYSNAVGLRIAGGILRSQRVLSRREWDAQMDAWIAVALQRLGALPTDLGRRAMKAVDGRWWDSRKELPDWTLVTRRSFDLGPRVTPWRIPDSDAAEDPVLATACSEKPRALPLEVPQRLGDVPIADVAIADFEVGSWAPASFPFTEPATRQCRSTDFARIAEVVRRAAEPTLGHGFDRPGSHPAAPAP